MCFLQYFQFVSVRTKQRTVLSHGDVGGSSCSALLLAVFAHFNIFVVDIWNYFSWRNVSDLIFVSPVASAASVT